MEIAVISDLHLGFGVRTERDSECFANAKQALEIAIERKPDFILIPGDIFDSGIPSPETLHEAFELFSIPKKAPNSRTRISINGIERGFQGIPIIAIHGTHEFRGKDYKNPLQVLEKAEALIYLHAQTALIEKEKEKIALHGLSGVPEKKALDVLKEWNPKPVQGAKNFLIMHQSIKEFLPTDDPMNVTIALENLPKGFDFYINGHLHWHNESKLNSGVLLIPGSTIITQNKKLESQKPKGILFLDSKSGKTEFIELKNQRKLFYHKVLFEQASLEEVKEKVKKLILESISNNSSPLTPLIRIKLTGSLAKGFTSSDIDLNEILKEFKEKAILSIDKDFLTQSFKKKISELRELQKSKQSIASLGLELLEKNLKGTDFNEAFDSKRVFELLSNDETEKVLELLLEEKEEKEIVEKNAKTEIIPPKKGSKLSDFS
jgi:DNA repair exonuclease SbcCD nuclease subunit